jgi:hemoglobin-like flavoprotein
MSLNVELLRQSFALVSKRNPSFAVRFYEILFERYPSVAPLFSDRARAHGPSKLAAALQGVVTNLDKPNVLAQSLGALGRRHVDYGATPERYAAVGECLIAAMAEAAGPHWNLHLTREWEGAYAALVSLMTPVATQNASTASPPSTSAQTTAA